MARGLEVDDPIEVVTPAQFKALETRQFDAPPGGFKLPTGYLSHSQVSMYLRCPRQYYFRYIKEMRRPPSAAMTVGSGTHEALETTHHHLVDHGTPAPDEALEAKFVDAFEDAASDVPSKAWKDDRTDKGKLKDIGLALVRVYNAKFAPAVKPRVKADGVRGIEQKFTVTVAGVPMLGYIDLIDTNAATSITPEEKAALELRGKEIPAILRTAIADFKTKAKSMSEGEVRGDLQLTLYSYVEQIPQIRFDQLLKQKIPKVKRAEAVRTAADHDWMKEVIHSVAAAITTGSFPPCAPTDWVCTAKWCGYWHFCRGQRV
jgi:CRISPR/Cas system-associated exonuclease Cas4 (RecB family)